MPHRNNQAGQVYEDQHQQWLERYCGDKQLRKRQLRGRYGTLELLCGKIQPKGILYPARRSRRQVGADHEGRKSGWVEPINSNAFQQTDSQFSLRQAVMDQEEIDRLSYVSHIRGVRCQLEAMGKA